MRAFSNKDSGRLPMAAPTDNPHLIDVLERSVENGKYKLKKLRERRDFCTKQYEEEMEEMDAEEDRLTEHLEQAQAKLRLARDAQGSGASSSEDDSLSEASDVNSEASPPASEVLGRTTGRMASDSMPSPGRAPSHASSEGRGLLSPRSGSARGARPPRAPQQVYVPRSMRQRAESLPQNPGVPSPTTAGDQGRVKAPPPGFDAPAHYNKNERIADRSLRGAPPPPPSRSVFDRIGHPNGNGAQHSSPPASVASGGDPGLPEMSDTRPAGAVREWRHREEAAGEAARTAGPEQQAQQAGEMFSREDTEGVRGEVNAQMDAMTAHNGTPNGTTNGTHLPSQQEGAGEGDEDVPAARKIREWDLNKSADPQADMAREPNWGGARQPMSSWADDDPASPSQAGRWGNSSSMGPRAPSNRGLRPSEGDFPGLRSGASSSGPKQDQEWMGNDDRMNASFPTLGGGEAPRPAGAWGAGGALLKERLTDGRPFVRLGATPQAEGPTQSIPEFERGAGLRHPSDDSTDHAHKVQVKSNKELQHMENIRGRAVNIMEGLELHLGVLLNTEQALLERQIVEWVRLGHQNMLRGRTFSAPRKWARGKGRITIQFGCCYNYAKDNLGRLPGIIPEEVVEPLPPVLVALAKRLVRWGIIPRDLEPDTAIVNVYEEDDCIPPHIDHHDFTRPFCTISLLSEEEIIFGSRLVPEAPGVFYNANGRHASLPLPTGSCLILKGNGADLAMHCVPPVKRRRMSITLRKMGVGHSAAVKAEAARVAAGANRTARVNGPPSDSWRSPSPVADTPGPRSLSLSDFIVTKPSREALSADKSERGGRWENEGSEER